MTLSDRLTPFCGNYELLYTPGNLLDKTEKGWVLAKKPLTSKTQDDLFQRVTLALLAEDLSTIPNLEGLIIRINGIFRSLPIHSLPSPLPEKVEFKSSDPHFSFLSNFFRTLIVFEGKLFPTSEHLYQWKIATLKDPGQSARHYFNMRTLSPIESREYCHSIEGEVAPEQKIAVMRDVILLKYQQNPSLKAALMATHPRPLVEKTENPFWGGEKNIMGKLLAAYCKRLTVPID